MEAGLALLAQNLEQDAVANNSRMMAQSFHNYHHRKTNSSEMHDTIDS